jgi:hypothetical protein
MTKHRIADQIATIRRKLAELQSRFDRAEAVWNYERSSIIKRRIKRKLTELENLDRIRSGVPLN